MKKSLVLAMAMALGVTASAYAANPFSDVPAGHWAYDSIDKLAAAGVIDGMGDGTYQGAKTMTRYEMAQIVAKAMAKGAADLEKLQAEFAEELNNLGVRVAALEKKADNVTITGQIRAEFVRNKVAGKKSDGANRLRTRLFLNGQINEDWAYHARIQNDQKWANGAADNDLKLNQAYVTGKLGGVAVTAGRLPFVVADGVVFDDTLEGIEVTYGKSVKVRGYAGREVDYANDAKLAGLDVATKFGVVDAKVGYTRIQEKVQQVNNDAVNLINIGLAAPIAKDLKLAGTYLHSDLKDAGTKNGYVIGLSYKGANKAKPGTWGLSAKYLRQGAGTYLASTERAASEMNSYRNAEFGKVEGFKGYIVAGQVTLAKNMVYMLDYTDIKGIETGVKTKQLWNRLQLTF